MGGGGAGRDLNDRGRLLLAAPHHQRGCAACGKRYTQNCKTSYFHD